MKEKMIEVGLRKGPTSKRSLQNLIRTLNGLPPMRFYPDVGNSGHHPSPVLIVEFQAPENELPRILEKMLSGGIELCYLTFGRFRLPDSSWEKNETVKTHDQNYPELFEKAMQEVSSLRHELLETLLKTPPTTPKINLPSMKGFQRIEVRSIIRCESEDNYTHVYFSDRKRITVSGTLQEFEHKLSPCGFFRIHHKHLVNTEHIVEYRKGKGGQVIMSDNTCIDVSTRKKQDFIRYMNSLPGQERAY